MTPPPRGHRGLAQRVRALFDDPPLPRELESPEAVDVAWVSETGRPLATAGSGTGEPEPLAEAVEAYVLAGPGGGREAGAVLDRAIEAAGRGPATPSAADAVESLLRYAARDESALARARALVSPGVASLLVRRLGELPDEGRRSLLLQRLPELGREIREATVEALRKPPARGLAQGPAGQGLLSLLATLTRSAPGMLEELVMDPDWRVVVAVVTITSERGGDGVLQILTLALTHDHPRVRRQALAALRKLGGQAAGELALSMLEDRDWTVRSEAARAVGDLNVSRGTGPLVERLRAEDHPEVLAANIEALGALRDASVVVELEGWTGHRTAGERSFELRAAALRALHRIGTPHALRIVEEASGDDDPRVRELVEILTEAGPAEAESSAVEEGGAGE